MKPASKQILRGIFGKTRATFKGRLLQAGEKIRPCRLSADSNDWLLNVTCTCSIAKVWRRWPSCVRPAHWTGEITRYQRGELLHTANMWQLICSQHQEYATLLIQVECMPLPTSLSFSTIAIGAIVFWATGVGERDIVCCTCICTTTKPQLNCALLTDLYYSSCSRR